MKAGKALDIAMFIACVALIATYPTAVQGTWFDNSFMWSLIWVVPAALYFGLRRKKNWKKILLGSFVFGCLFGFILEFTANISNTWIVPTTIFPFRLEGVTAIEILFGYFAMTMFILIFYEHFFDTDRNRHTSPHIWYAIIPAIFVIAALSLIHVLRPDGITFEHAYLFMGVAAILPLLYQISRRPRLFTKYSQLAVSLFFVFLIAEIVGLNAHFWEFPARTYIGTVFVFGVTFPLEEIIFWMLLYPATVAAYYEMFIDDER